MKRSHPSRRFHSGGFARADLAIILTIVAFSGAILLGYLKSGVRDVARKTCVENLLEIHKGLEWFRGENGRFPNGQMGGKWPNGSFTFNPPMAFTTLLDSNSVGRVEKRRLFCPANKSFVPENYWPSTEGPNRAYSSYSYWFGYARGITNLVSPQAQHRVPRPFQTLTREHVLVSDNILLSQGPSSTHFQNHQDNGTFLGGNVLYADGRVEWSDIRECVPAAGPLAELVFGLPK